MQELRRLNFRANLLEGSRQHCQNEMTRSTIGIVVWKSVLPTSGQHCSDGQADETLSFLSL
eukprot:5649387-Amphidinium_carterae.1